MKKNVLISSFMNPMGRAMAAAFRSKGVYVYGIDRKEDYEGICDRAFRFNMDEFASDAGYRIRFLQIFNEIIPNLDALVICDDSSFGGRLGDIQLEDWHRSMNENVTGPMLLCKLFRTRLEKSKGAIVFVGANLDLAADSESIGYKTSRAAYSGLYWSMAEDLRGKVNVDRIVCRCNTEMGEGQPTDFSWKNAAEISLKLLQGAGKRKNAMLSFG
jgi:NAD(P)-dependent dehydrogenase (short-subunit alcohol dehydrogenase family)